MKTDQNNTAVDYAGPSENGTSVLGYPLGNVHEADGSPGGEPRQLQTCWPEVSKVGCMTVWKAGSVQLGDVVVRREVWHGRPWSALPVVVIQDDAELLAVHLSVGSPFGFVDSHPLGVHPWSANDSWQGLDVVMLHRPDDHYSVWFFGPFAVYINLQEPYRRTGLGFDTFDHELDVVIGPDGQWAYKDEDRLPMAVDTGRFTASEVDSIRRTGNMVGDMLNNNETWWDPLWAQWTPPDDWPTPSLPPTWADK